MCLEESLGPLFAMYWYFEFSLELLKSLSLECLGVVIALTEGLVFSKQ